MGKESTATWKFALGLVAAFATIRLVSYCCFWSEEQRREYHRSVKRLGGFPQAV
jgi:hypothetical protein